MKFVPSILLLLFGVAFLGLWALERRNHFTAILAAGFLALGLAILSQTAGVPANVGHNSLLAGCFYVSGILLISESVLQRSGRHFPLGAAAIYLTGILAGLWYFFYVDRNVIARIYILNFGLSLILLQTCWRARFLLSGSWTDKALFWIVAVVGVHFVPRTFLTIGSIAPEATIDVFGQSEYWQSILLTVSIFGAGGGLGLLVVFVADIVGGLRRERDIDPLTGVLNRRGLERRVNGPGKGRSARVMAVCDLDEFKAVNDTYGHDVGDRVLTAFANIIRQNIRENDIVARTGGEEFVIILENTDNEQAFALSERIRTALEKTSFLGASTVAPVTCSFGLARFDGEQSLWMNLKRADSLLYNAKRGGRNRTCAEWLPSMPAPLHDRKA